VINKIDLAPLVGANLGVMAADARRMRIARPFIFLEPKKRGRCDEIADFILEKGGLSATGL
jgi:urease accessory protein